MRSTLENSNACNTIIKHFVAKPILGKHTSKVRDYVPLFSIFMFFFPPRSNQTIYLNAKQFTAPFSDDAECELNCKPIGMNYFATLNDVVIDGTTCYSSVDFARRIISGRAMCVDGICKVKTFEKITI